MKKALSSVLVLVLSCLPAATVLGQTVWEKEPQPESQTISRDSCVLEWVEHDWDFATGAHGFARQTCDGAGGVQAWEWGPPAVAGAPANVWGTVLTANYSANSGDGLLSPPSRSRAIQI